MSKVILTQQEKSNLSNITAKALVVNISGAEGALAADKTNAEIWAAYQAGTPMYAIWNGTVLTPVQVESDWALFGYDLPPMSGSVSISESGGATEVLGETGQLSASQVSFDPTDLGMESTNVQGAIEEVNAKIPAKPLLRTATLTTSGWSGNTQTVTVSGVVADKNAQEITVTPDPEDDASWEQWGNAGVRCKSQGNGTLTFIYTASAPTANISVNISIKEART